MVVGNDSDGAPKLWIVSKLFASTINVSFDRNSDTISSAYSEHSLKRRELIVESLYNSTTISRHHIFIPLESAILVATFTYNGSVVNPVPDPHAHVNRSRILTLCRSMSRCASLGVHKIGATLYTLCAGSSGICICGLRTSNDSDGQKWYTGATNCRLLDHPRNGIDVHQISNIVIYQSHKFNGNLLFALNNCVYETTPAYGVERIIPIPSEIFGCLVITRLRIIASKLIIYCTNNSVVHYNMDTGDLEFLPQFNNHMDLYFPCSDATDFSVNMASTEISYGMSDRSSGLRIGRFKFGACIVNQNHHIFLYINTRSNSLHIVNSSLFTLHNLTEGTSLAMCMNNEYYDDRPLVIGERYIIAHDIGCHITSVFDVQDITSPIITRKNKPFLLATVISNLSAIINNGPTTATTASLPVAEELVIAPPVVVLLGIILFCSIINIIALVVICWKR